MSPRNAPRTLSTRIAPGQADHGTRGVGHHGLDARDVAEPGSDLSERTSGTTPRDVQVVVTIRANGDLLSERHRPSVPIHHQPQVAPALTTHCPRFSGAPRTDGQRPRCRRAFLRRVRGGERPSSLRYVKRPSWPPHPPGHAELPAGALRRRWHGERRPAPWREGTTPACRDAVMQRLLPRSEADRGLPAHIAGREASNRLRMRSRGRCAYRTAPDRAEPRINDPGPGASACARGGWNRSVNLCPVASRFLGSLHPGVHQPVFD